MVTISRERDEVLKRFERPRLPGRLDGAMADDVDYLLGKSFLVEHEGHLLSVVTRPRSAMQSALPRPAADAEERASFR